MDEHQKVSFTASYDALVLKLFAQNRKHFSLSTFILAQVTFSTWGKYLTLNFANETILITAKEQSYAEMITDHSHSAVSVKWIKWILTRRRVYALSGNVTPFVLKRQDEETEIWLCNDVDAETIHLV